LLKWYVNEGVYTLGSDSNTKFYDKTALDAKFNEKQNIPSTQSANMVYAGPSSGSAEIPAFRKLVAADIPGKLDKLETSGKKVYSHTNATQSEIEYTDLPTVSTVMSRDGAGKSQVESPTAGKDIANKAYVDTNFLGQTTQILTWEGPGDQLQAYISTLPRFQRHNIILTVTSDIPTTLDYRRFQGGGTGRIVLNLGGFSINGNLEAGVIQFMDVSNGTINGHVNLYGGLEHTFTGVTVTGITTPRNIATFNLIDCVLNSAMLHNSVLLLSGTTTVASITGRSGTVIAYSTWTGTIGPIVKGVIFIDNRSDTVKGPQLKDTVPTYSEWTHTKHFKYQANSNFATGFAFKIDNDTVAQTFYTMSYVISYMDTLDYRQATGEVNLFSGMQNYYNLAKAVTNSFPTGNIQLVRLIQAADGRYIFFPASTGGSGNWFIKLTIEAMTNLVTGVCVPVNPVPVYPTNLPTATASIDISLAVA
jgi:hypothetical protein